MNPNIEKDVRVIEKKIAFMTAQKELDDVRYIVRMELMQGDLVTAQELVVSKLNNLTQ